MPMKTIEGYSKEKYTNTSVLLAGGGAKALSDFIGSLSWDSTNKKIKYTPVGGSATDLVTLSWDNIANKPTSLPANGGNADTVSNKHVTDFYKSGCAYPCGKSDKQWHKVASFTQSISGTQINTGITFYVGEFYLSRTYGILNIQIRNEAGYVNPEFCYVVWSLNNGIDPNEFVVGHSYSGNTVTYNLYAWRNGWSSYNIRKIAEQAWGSDQDVWTCYDAVNGNSNCFASIPESNKYISSNLTISNPTNWNSIIGKPSSYTPASHTHPYLPLSGGTMSNTNVVTNLNADLLDGYHASDFATSGHTHSLGNKSASDLSSTYPSGISVGGIYANGYPFTYGCTITASGNGGYFQIAGQWNSSVTGDSNYDFPTEMYIRGRRDSYDVWTTWTRVLTDRNYTNVLDNRYYTETEADNRFVNVTGDTMTGLLTTTSGSNHSGIKVGNTYVNAINGELIFQNNGAIRFGGDSWDWNIWAGLKYEHSSKTIYLGLAGNSVFTANNDQSGGTLNLSGIYNISSTFYNIKVGSILQHIPATSGWYTIAQVSGYFNYDLYITGDWYTGMPSTVRVNICNINGTTKITQFAGYIGSHCSQIRLGQVNTDVWDVQLYINGQTGTLGEQKCIFTGYGGLIVYNTNTVSSTSYSVTNTLAFGQISGISLTSSNWSSYVSIPTVGNGTVTVTQAGSTIGSFTMNQSGNTLIALNDTNTNYYPIRSYTSGLKISSYSGSTNCELWVPNANSTSQAGVVSTGTQTFAGNKTFTGAMTVNNTITFGANNIYGIRTSSDNYGRIGESTKRFYQCYVKNSYSTNGFYEDSDERLKNIIKSVKVDLDELSKLRKIYYIWKNPKENQSLQLGMIAQDVQRLYPELVSVDKETGYLSLAYDRISVIALEAIDTLYEEYKQLKERVNKLEKLLYSK